MIPQEVERLLDKLCEHGFDAYLVGGCVRDKLMSISPHDYDIATNALPHEIKSVFSDCKTIDTGIKHGTVAVISGGEAYEITSFRSDGRYTDGRHPDSVHFESTIEADLSRRDFTVNAVALSGDGRIVDPFGGQKDVIGKTIRCVGQPAARFAEDALRILRAVRFQSSLGFDIESETRRAMEKSAGLLCNVSGERIAAELKRIVMGDYALKALCENTAVIAAVLPELSDSIGFDQQNGWHIYDVYTHSAHVVANAAKRPLVRLAALLHDCGKPRCFFLENGRGRFFGHEGVSADMAAQAMRRLNFSRSDAGYIKSLIRCHGAKIAPDAASARKWMARGGTEWYLDLLALKMADDLSKNPKKVQESLSEERALESAAAQAIAQKPCLTLSGLAIGGGDLLSEGFAAGPSMGRILNSLLQMVIDGEQPNEREALLREAQKLKTQKEQ